MKYVLTLSSLLLVVGCDQAAPREVIPEGQSLQSALRPPPEIETDDTDGTGSGSTVPICDESCGSSADCASGSACYAGLCNASDCCTYKKLTNTTVCTDGTCCVPNKGTCACSPARIVCDAGFANCNGDLSDGCEGKTTTPTSCGTSCTNCTVTVAHADGKCTDTATCDYTTCAEGWADCDGNRANGCETSTITSAAHCGGCNMGCSAPSGGSAFCKESKCDFSCGGGTKKCGGECKACCDDKDCTNAPSRCDEGKCNDGVCSYAPKSCLVRDCYSPPSCDDETGACKATPLTGGTCGNNACIVDTGTCNAGVCEGAAAKNCSIAVPICKVGVCDQADGSCQYESQADGTACTPDNKCQAAGTCIGGVCNGAVNDCADPGACRSSICNPATGACDVVPLIKGTPCTLSNPCRQNEECDGDGACAGSMLSDGTPCPGTCGADQASQCVSGECGCVALPDMTPVIIVEEPADMAVAGGGGAAKDKGCSVSGGAPSLDGLIALVFFVGLLGGLRWWLGRPQTRLVKYAGRRRR